MKYRRILLKMSGEVLSGKTPIDFDNVMTAAGHIKALYDVGCQIGVLSAAAICGAADPAAQWTGAVRTASECWQPL